jgi:hypothetical protein
MYIFLVALFNVHRAYKNQTGKGCMTHISVFYLCLIIMLTGPRSAIMTLYLGLSKIKSIATGKSQTAEAVRPLPLDAETMFRFEASASGICGGLNGTRTRFPLTPLIFPVSTISKMLNAHILFIYHDSVQS